MLTTLRSTRDASVNFVQDGPFPGSIEARYVRRDPEEVIVYLSSQTGCRQACRFCHLTQTGQTDLVDVTVEDYVDQARTVLAHYARTVDEGGLGARHVNYNFMARGEVFANPHVLRRGDELLDQLASLAIDHRLLPRFKFSTIMPSTLADRDLAWIFPAHQPDIYYSLYSVDPVWRRRWMPKAMEPGRALEKLAAYQRATRKLVVLHWALIDGENDSCSSVDHLIDAIRDSGLRADINLVRYNPASSELGRESPEAVIDARARQLADGLPGSRVQIVGRVGHDVAASCGMFITSSTARRPDRLRIPAVLDSSPSRYLGATRRADLD